MGIFQTKYLLLYVGPLMQFPLGAEP